jgi:hypothetical protein
VSDAPAGDELPLLFRVESGDPTDEELAALVAVLAARQSAIAASAPHMPAVRSAWADPARRLRRPHRHGPGAWRASALPS